MTPTYNFSVKIFHLDLRIQVMTPKALHELANQLIKNGFTSIVLDWEATFPFRKHQTIANQFVYSRDEIEKFLKHCATIGLETIPIQQCFGHVEYILMHDRYAHLREDERDICQICPLKVDQALPLMRDLFTELAESHNTNYFYVGCDETYVLGKCPACAAKAQKSGKSRLYVDYLKKILGLVNELGKRPICPADMLLKYPEAAKLLPKNTILVDWNYGWNPNKFGDPKPLYEAGFEFWGAMALRSGPDNYYLISWEKHLNNFRDFLPYSKNNNYKGIVLTSWSTSGIYGFEWDAFYEPVAMHPIRRVYPLIGFNILIEAFYDAFSNDTQFKPAQFVEKYAMKRFGISKNEAQLFFKALITDPSSVYKPKEEFYKPVNEVFKKVSSASKSLQSIIPTLNKTEFNHFLLMLAIRENYLSFKIIEETLECDTYSNKERLSAITKLKKFLKVETSLSKKFSSLMKGYLQPAEIVTENKWRSRKWSLLLKTIERVR
jgi:hypothetical protein